MSNLNTQNDPYFRSAPVWFVIAAWSIPALMLADFTLGDIGWYALIPISAMLITTWVDHAVTPLRYWVSALAVTFVIPFFATQDSGGIMQDMHPINLGLFVLCAAIMLIKIHKDYLD